MATTDGTDHHYSAEALASTNAGRSHRRTVVMETRHARRRRRVESMWTRRHAWSCLLLCCWTSHTADAGRSELAWSTRDGETDGRGATAMAVDATGAVVVTECSIGGETVVITKYSTRGDAIWRETLRADDVLSDATAACATAIVTDTARNIYVTGTIDRHADDMDVFVARLSSTGSLAWTQTLGTPYTDVATSIAVDHGAVFLGGYSAGHLALGRASPLNCRDKGDIDDSCDDGFVVRLAATDGAVQWISAITSAWMGSRIGENRVFDVATTPESVVIVGETHGRVDPNATASTRHSGDVFVRRMAIDTGASLWTTQLSSGGDVADYCQRTTGLYTRGDCAVAARHDEVFLVGTTRGLISTLPSQRGAFPDVCRSLADCEQAFFARLDVESGSVQWIHQLVHAAHTTGERIVTGEDDDAVFVLATADAGFFSRAESMEQLAVFRASGDGTVVEWTAEFGLAGEDYAVALAPTPDTRDLVVLGRGSADKSLRGQWSSQSWLRRVRALDGAIVPVCTDVVGFDTARMPHLNATREGDVSKSLWRVIELPLIRNETARCVDAAAAVLFRYTVGVQRTTTSATSTSGLVQWAASQSTASLALAVPRAATSLRITLESVTADTVVDATSNAWMLDFQETEETVVLHDTAAADGRLWQQLTWVALVVAIVITALVVGGGRIVCWRSQAWSWRRAKAFQYTTLRLRRRARTKESTSNDGAEEETEELRSHLEEIQQLNDSLDSLLSSHTTDATRSPALVVPSSPTRALSKNSPGWKRSLGRLLPSPRRSKHRK